uniref:Uncharacterized protein n=1 Tax=Tanacetum cinerariifolium TaxID=118510 RepID=A0A6L2JXZ6_TANCI|nr:hypothetical protein [Tanacetum cinerariifolium]
MKNVKSVQFDECDLIKFKDASTVVMVNVKEIDTVSNMYHVVITKNSMILRSIIQSLIYEKVEVNIIGNIFQIFVKEIGTWNIHISNDIESNDSNNGDISSNRNGDPSEALDDFIQHVVEDKEVKKTPPKDPNADDSKPPGFEKCHIYNKDDVTSQAGDEDVSFSTDQVKDNHTATHKDMAADEVVTDNSKAPSFENFIKENKACSRSSSTSRARKCSTSNYSRKDLKGFSFIDEMNRMIKVGEALGYDVKGCKKYVRYGGGDDERGGEVAAKMEVRWRTVAMVSVVAATFERWCFAVDAAEEFKENMLSDYCCQAKLMLLINVDKSN